MALGLVLGGGGVVGIAWEIGVLSGLADALGWDPNAAATIVGTSAGAVNGTQLRHGRTVDELVARQRAGGDPLATESGDAGGPTASPDPNAVMDVFRLWASADRMDVETARRVGELACTTSPMSEEHWIGSFETTVFDPDWPERDLRITGVSVATGRRVLWTAASGVPLRLAVAASCAVPGLFPPVAIDGDRYVDGGLWSGSNADVLAGESFDAVLFIGPMGSGATGIGGLSARMLDAERTVLADSGVELRTVEPGTRFKEAGMQLMDVSRRIDALEIGLLEGEEAAAALADVLTDA